MRNIVRLCLILPLAVLGCGDNIIPPSSAKSPQAAEARGALGDKTAITDRAHVVELLASAIATNGAPTGTNGISSDLVKRGVLIPHNVRVAVKSTAGSGTMTVSLRLWQRLAGVGWFVSKTLNGGSAIAETGTDTIGYSEECDLIDGADRYYLEITAIAGTSTAVTGYIVAGRP